MDIFTSPDEKETVNDRIQKIIDHYSLNKSSFSKAIGLGNSMTITNIVTGRKNKPSYDVLRKIVEHFPINPSWLLVGKGAMILDAKEELENEAMEVDKIVNAILQFPEKFEKNLMFAKYMENERHKAIVEHYVNIRNKEIAPETFKSESRD